MKQYLHNHVLNVHQGDKILDHTGNHILGHTGGIVCGCTVCGNSFKLSKDLKHHTFVTWRWFNNKDSGNKKYASYSTSIHVSLVPNFKEPIKC